MSRKNLWCKKPSQHHSFSLKGAAQRDCDVYEEDMDIEPLPDYPISTGRRTPPPDYLMISTGRRTPLPDYPTSTSRRTPLPDYPKLSSKSLHEDMDTSSSVSYLGPAPFPKLSKSPPPRAAAAAAVISPSPVKSPLQPLMLPPHRGGGEPLKKNSKDIIYELELRKITKNYAAKTINQLDISNFNVCVSNPKQSVFRSRLKNVKRLGAGSFGEVYKVTYNEIPMVVKEAILTDKEWNLLERERIGRKVLHPDELSKQSYPTEYKLLQYTQDLLMKKSSPNFLFIYHISVCDACQLNLVGGREFGKCYLTFMEPADSDLATAIHAEKLKSTRAQLSCLYQLLMAVHAIQTEYGIVHNDIKTPNVLVKYIPQGGVFQYNCSMARSSFVVQNCGILILLADFGVADSQMPKYSNYGYYGYRNVSVDLTTQKLKPIRSKLTVTGDGEVKPSPLIMWKEGQMGTENLFHARFDPQPQHVINLNDVIKYPPQDFNNDVLDVIRMFIGGKQTVQPGYHPAIPYLNPKLAELLSKYNPTSFPYSEKSINYLFAGMMMKSLYRIPENADFAEDSLIIVDKYRLI